MVKNTHQNAEERREETGKRDFYDLDKLNCLERLSKIFFYLRVSSHEVLGILLTFFEPHAHEANPYRKALNKLPSQSLMICLCLVLFSSIQRCVVFLSFHPSWVIVTRTCRTAAAETCCSSPCRQLRRRQPRQLRCGGYSFPPRQRGCRRRRRQLRRPDLRTLPEPPSPEPPLRPGRRRGC